jgi:hypothetical protein
MSEEPIPTTGGEPRQRRIQEDRPYAAWSADGAPARLRAGGLHRVDVRATQTLSSDGAHGRMDWRSAG